jgi:hypothetical protein
VYWANSAGCQVIGYGAYDSNSFNEFMKVTAGITWNSYSSYRNTFSSTGYYKGYYVVDRQLGITSPSGTDYGSGSLYELYTKGDLDAITAWSTAQRANANFGYISQCDSYPAHCEIEMFMSTEVNSLPCSVNSDDECEVVETCSIGDIYEATGLYRNTYGNLWYEIITKSGDTGYVYAVKSEEQAAYRWGCCAASQKLSYAVADPQMDLDAEMHNQAIDGLPITLLML